MKVEEETHLTTCLRSLTYCFVYISGVDFLKQRPHLFTKLFDMSNSHSEEVKKLVLGIFIGLCKCMKGGFDCINKAAINTARRANVSPYANLLNSL